MAHKEELVKIVGKGNVSDKPELLESFASDFSFTPPRKPWYVVKPANGEEVQNLIKWAKQTKVPLIPVSSGPPRFRGDTISRMGGVVVDMGRMNKIVRVDRRNKVSLVEAGVTYSQLKPALDKASLRLLMPLCPRGSKSVVASYLEREPITIPKYQWDFPDPLLNTEIIFGTGEMMRTGDAAGPGTLEEQWAAGGAQKTPYGPLQVDYYRVVQGAQGTMGIVNWASFKSELLPRFQKLYFVPSHNLEALFNLAYPILRRRLAEECFILNGLNLATLLSATSDEIDSLRFDMPPWILLLGLAGYDWRPEERVAYQEEAILDLAQKAGVEPVPALAGIPGSKVLGIIQKPSEEPYWKIRYRGGCCEIFFLTTLDSTPKFIEVMHEAMGIAGFPASDMGVYIQPMVQGVACHCEFNLNYNPQNLGEVERVRSLFMVASEALMNNGAYFSRPYGNWADLVYGRDGEGTAVLRIAKDIFDPEHIMNPGKLCF